MEHSICSSRIQILSSLLNNLQKHGIISPKDFNEAIGTTRLPCGFTEKPGQSKSSHNTVKLSTVQPNTWIPSISLHYCDLLGWEERVVRASLIGYHDIPMPLQMGFVLRSNGLITSIKKHRVETLAAGTGFVNCSRRQFVSNATVE